MYGKHLLFCLFFYATVYLFSCTFVPVTKEPYVGAGWSYNYDPKTGVAGMKKGYHLSRNDTCHVYKLTDQQRHDIHTPQGEINVQIYMYQAVITHHGETMNLLELKNISYSIWNYCKSLDHIIKYNFYVSK
ncbi:uncharacterized protein LOC125657923 isoform X2 [Ostrea edulis]|uniref:uncharacterized protein LOC125657923 isoform X2 n=1 Tax=Ostrea edulis TaxID=37623 RepID=UPI0024AEDB91|nr:uncharacterized protein LOC125657923 isoform X2 [Ostrea edulis]